MNIIVYANSSVAMGEGHAIRVLNLLLSRISAEDSVVWLYKKMTSRALDQIIKIQSVILKKIFDNQDILEHSKVNKDAVVIVDSYELPEHIYQSLKTTSSCLVVFDDLANRKLAADILIDASPVRVENDYLGLVDKDTKLLIGKDYLVLHPCYGHSINTEDRKGIHIFFGSTDVGGLTYPFTKYLVAKSTNFNLKVVITKETKNIRCLERLAECNDQLELIYEPDNLMESLNSCFLAFGAPGTATWERLAMGLDCYLFSFNSAQESILKDLQNVGLIRYLGSHEKWELAMRDFSFSDFVSTKVKLDGKGSVRIFEAVEDCLCAA